MLTIDSQMIDGNLAIDAQRQYGNHADYLDVNAIIQHGRIAVDGYEKPAGLQCYIPLFSNISPVWGELALDAGTHVRASVAKRTNPTTGLIETLGNNLPRFELHDNLLALLDEPDIKNHCTDSEAFRAAISGWLNTNCTVTDDAVVAPDGNTTSDKIVEANDLANQHLVYDVVARANFTDDKDVTLSAYVKEGERNWIRLYIQTKALSQRYAYFNLNDGTIHTTEANTTARIEAESVAGSWNGHYRCSITADIQNGANNPLFQVAIAEADNDVTYDGDGASGIYVWGAQIEELPVPTTYIATSGATATRATESGYPLWTLPTGLFDAEGTASIWVRFGYAESVVPNTTSSGIVVVTNGANSLLYNRTSGGGVAYFNSNDGTTLTEKAYNWVANTWYKLVIKWSSTTSKMRVGVDSGAGIVFGTEVAFDGSYTLGAALRLAFGLYGPLWLRDLRLWDYVLTDTMINAGGSP